MVTLTQEMKDFVARTDIGRVLATISPDGYPNIGPKGTIQVYDDNTLLYCEFIGKHHHQNVKKNPRVAIACIDFPGRQGFRFLGEATVVEDRGEIERLAEKVPVAARAMAVVLVKVNEVYALGGPQVGERVL